MNLEIKVGFGMGLYFRWNPELKSTLLFGRLVNSRIIDKIIIILGVGKLYGRSK